MNRKHLFRTSWTAVFAIALAGCGTKALPIAEQFPETNAMVRAAESDASKPAEISPTAGVTEGSQSSATKTNETAPAYNELNAMEKYVILRKGTERPFTGEYTDLAEPGMYICRRCNAPLYNSENKFHSSCGWPSFDDEIAGAVERHAEIETQRVEILCCNCGGHLGHVFVGEQFTAKNVRHCVNSVSMTFVPRGKEPPPVIRTK